MRRRRRGELNAESDECDGLNYSHMLLLTPDETLSSKIYMRFVTLPHTLTHTLSSDTHTLTRWHICSAVSNSVDII